MKKSKGEDDELYALMQTASDAVKKEYKEAISDRADRVLRDVEVWASTGSLALDRAIAGRVPGGIPMGPTGRFIHIFGDPSLGKSLVLDQIILSVQRLGGIGLISETEGSRDLHFSRAIGINPKRLQIQKPANVGQMFDWGIAWIEMIRRKQPDIPILWGLDSLTMTQSMRTYQVAMTGKEGGAYQFGGGKAQEVSAGVNRLAPEVQKHPTSFVVLNQVREDPTVRFGKKKKPTGGKALPFAASVEIELSSSELGKVFDRRNQAVGRWIHARIVKNKIADPFGECHFMIHFRKGVQEWHGVLEMLERENLVSVKRDKAKKLVGEEFIVVSTGEVLTLREFIPWCQREKILETILAPEGAPPASTESDKTAQEGIE